MSIKGCKPTYSIESDNRDLEMYPFRMVMSMLEGKCGVLKITEKYKDKFEYKHDTRAFNVKHLGFGFPVNPSGPVRILDRSTGDTLCELKPMYCTCVKEITEFRSSLSGETIRASRYVFTQVNHRVNNVDQYKFTSLVIFTPDEES